jgi:beta-lactamase regulating signal transducer with metallopeptidase domain
MMIAELFPALIDWPFVAYTIKATLALSVVLVFCRLSRNLSASSCHLMISTVLILTALMPLTSSLLPDWDVITIPALHSYQDGPGVDTEVEGSWPSSSLSLAEIPEPGPVESTQKQILSSWQGIAVITYFFGILLMAGRVMAVSLWSLWHRSRGTQPIGKNSRILQIASSTMQQAGLKRPVSVLLSDRISVPMACGWLKPAVLLPVNAIDWSDKHLQSVLLHEIAHIRRGDAVTSKIAHLAAIWQWFNPVYWLALVYLQIEREKACDDIVINAGVQNADYAEHLIATGRSATSMIWGVRPALRMARKRNIEGRIIDILNESKNRRSVSVRVALYAGSVLLSLVTSLACMKVDAQDNTFETAISHEKAEIVTAVNSFYTALNKGENLNAVGGKFLSADYFTPPHLTLGSQHASEWDDIRKRMIVALYSQGMRFNPLFEYRLTEMQIDNDRCFVTQKTDIINRAGGRPPMPLVAGMEHRFEMIKENGAWKIARFDNGVRFMRTGTGDSLHSSFLFWVEDFADSTTPLGAVVFEIVPTELRNGGSNYLTLEMEI